MDETNLSIKATFARKQALEAEAAKLWEDFARVLHARIPASLQTWAKNNWIIPKKGEVIINDHFLFTYWLKGVMELHQAQKNVPRESDGSLVVPWHHFRRDGFETIEDAEQAFADLGEAWRSLIRVETQRDSQPADLLVYFYVI